MGFFSTPFPITSLLTGPASTKGPLVKASERVEQLRAGRRSSGAWRPPMQHCSQMGNCLKKGALLTFSEKETCKTNVVLKWIHLKQFIQNKYLHVTKLHIKYELNDSQLNDYIVVVCNFFL